MTNLRKAAEQALKYFEDAHGLEDAEVESKKHTQALAQPERKWVGLTKRDLKKPFLKGRTHGRP
jgi:hypothetical protein